MADEKAPVLVPVRYSHNHGIDRLFRVVLMPKGDHRHTIHLFNAGTQAEQSVRQDMVEEYGEDDVKRDEDDYGGFEAYAFLDEGDEIEGADGNAYRLRLERADAPRSMSKEELAAKNKNGTECAACGGQLKGPYPGMMYCPPCEEGKP